MASSFSEQHALKFKKPELYFFSTRTVQWDIKNNVINYFERRKLVDVR